MLEAVISKLTFQGFLQNSVVANSNSDLDSSLDFPD